MSTPAGPSESLPTGQRLDRLEAILRNAGLHEPGCPASHDCNRLGCGVYHFPQGCICWLSEQAKGSDHA